MKKISIKEYKRLIKTQKDCKHDRLKAKVVGNPMVYDCMLCGKVIKSKKE